MLDAVREDLPLARLTRQWLDAPEEATPLASAAAATVLGTLGPGGVLARVAGIVDDWVALRGTRFAVLAALELACLARRVPDLCHGLDYLSRLRRRRTRPGDPGALALRRALAGRVRAHLALGDDQSYQEAQTVVSTHRRQELARSGARMTPSRAMTSFLLPTETDWVGADCVSARATGGLCWEARWLLLCSVSSTELVRALAGPGDGHQVGTWPDVLGTVLDGVGPDLLDQLLEWLDGRAGRASSAARLLAAVGAIPTDTAFGALLSRVDRPHALPALHEATWLSPERAIRMLAVRLARGRRRDVTTAALGEALRCQVMADRELARTVRRQLLAQPAGSPRSTREESAARLIDGLLTERIPPEAPASRVPEVLTTPPRPARPKARDGEPVVEGLPAPPGLRVSWARGEREFWTDTTGPELFQPAARSWEQQAEILAGGGELGFSESVRFFAHGPSEIVLAHLPAWRPVDHDLLRGWMPRVVGRFGAHAFAPVWNVVSSATNRARAGELLLPFQSSEIAWLMADWLARLPSARHLARTWLVRHGEFAARALVPRALGPAGPTRRAAGLALTTLVSAGRAGAVAGAASGLGPETSRAITDLLERLSSQSSSVRVSSLPTWARAGVLPRVTLSGGTEALPAEAAERLCAMLATATPEVPHAGVASARRGCDAPSLAAFCWALFLRWVAAGCPKSGAWALTCLGVVGDDETARRLGPVIRAWPGVGGHARAVAGLDALTALGTDLALAHLQAIARTARYEGLRRQAQLRCDRIASERGLTADQLADRAVPDCGLSRTGQLVLDYGRRRFVVGFDEFLRPCVTNEDGTPRRTLPPPGARDDPGLAGPAHRRFLTVREDVKAIAADQMTRLETAMVTGRRWSTTEFLGLLVRHPLLWHVVRRLVWGTYGGDGRLREVFRLAEDRTCADLEETPLGLADGSRVGICHPVDLAPCAVRRWSARLTDYGITQPFPQLGRETFVLAPAEARQPFLGRFAEALVPTDRLLGLERRGWRRGAPQSAGIQHWLERPVPGNQAIVVEIRPGISVGSVREFPEQRLTQIWIGQSPVDSWSSPSGVPFGELDAVTISETLRDLASISP